MTCHYSCSHHLLPLEGRGHQLNFNLIPPKRCFFRFTFFGPVSYFLHQSIKRRTNQQGHHDSNSLIGQLSVAANATFQVKFSPESTFVGLEVRPVSQMTNGMSKRSYLGHTPASPSSPTFPNSVRTNICTDHRKMGCDDSP